MLRPAQVKHTMAVLRPEWYHLSPAVGCAATAGDAVLSNMYRTVSTTRESPFLAACDVARELFHSSGGGAPRPARTRSRAAGHLDAGDLGALCVTKVVTPRVVAAARAYFDCPTLDGVGRAVYLTWG